MEDDQKKWKTNQSNKINLIGCDTIVNSPSFKLIFQRLRLQDPLQQYNIAKPTTTLQYTLQHFNNLYNIALAEILVDNKCVLPIKYYILDNKKISVHFLFGYFYFCLMWVDPYCYVFHLRLTSTNWTSSCNIVWECPF